MTNQPVPNDKQQPPTPADSKKAKRRAAEARKKLLSDPDKILESVLARTSWQVPNLSHIVEEKFNQVKEYRLVLDGQLSDIVYASTVEPILPEEASKHIGVFPENFSGTVNPDPSAILSLPCINSKSNQRRKRKTNKTKSNAAAAANNTQNNKGNNNQNQSSQKKQYKPRWERMGHWKSGVARQG